MGENRKADPSPTFAKRRERVPDDNRDDRKPEARRPLPGRTGVNLRPARHPQRSHTPTSEKTTGLRDARVRLLRYSREDTRPEKTVQCASKRPTPVLRHFPESELRDSHNGNHFVPDYVWTGPISVILATELPTRSLPTPTSQDDDPDCGGTLWTIKCRSTSRGQELCAAEV